MKETIKYEVRKFWVPDSEEVDEIMDMVKNGWEFVVRIDHYFIFRRPL